MNTTKEITIRGFENGDAINLSQLIIDNLMLVNSRDYGEEAARQLARFYSPQLLLEYAQNGNLYVAVEHSTIIGTAALDQDQVRNVFVRIDHHQQGIGKILMQHIENIARQQGKIRLSLRASVSAVVFYQKLGFAIVEEIEERIGNAVIKVVEMAKTLPVVSFREQNS
jgi:N-acetylglutamate synthase-like GNAT family acetyltransferase